MRPAVLGCAFGGMSVSRTRPLTLAWWLHCLLVGFFKNFTTLFTSESSLTLPSAGPSPFDANCPEGQEGL